MSCQCPPGHPHPKTHSEPGRQEDVAGASPGRCVVQLQGLLGCYTEQQCELPLLKADLAQHLSTATRCHLREDISQSLGSNMVPSALFFAGGDHGLLLTPAPQVAVPLPAPLCKGSLNASCSSVGFWVVSPQNMGFESVNETQQDQIMAPTTSSVFHPI